MNSGAVPADILAILARALNFPLYKMDRVPAPRAARPINLDRKRSLSFVGWVSIFIFSYRTHLIHDKNSLFARTRMYIAAMLANSSATTFLPTPYREGNATGWPQLRAILCSAKANPTKRYRIGL